MTLFSTKHFTVSGNSPHACSTRLAIAGAWRLASARPVYIERAGGLPSQSPLTRSAGQAACSPSNHHHAGTASVSRLQPRRCAATATATTAGAAQATRATPGAAAGPRRGRLEHRRHRRPLPRRRGGGARCPGAPRRVVLETVGSPAGRRRAGAGGTAGATQRPPSATAASAGPPAPPASSVSFRCAAPAVVRGAEEERPQSSVDLTIECVHRGRRWLLRDLSHHSSAVLPIVIHVAWPLRHQLVVLEQLQQSRYF